MSADRQPQTPLLAGPAAGRRSRAADDLLTAMALEPAGQVSPSLYETARLVSLAPWLTGHAERVRYLLSSQRADGGWGPPEGYALVPTLSAVEALLVVLRTAPAVDPLTRAVDRGLQMLTRWLSAARSIPDTPAVDLIVPALTAAINRHLTRADAPPALRHWRATPRLRLPNGMDDRRLTAVHGLIGAGRAVPEKLLHALEVVGALARGAQGVRPTPSGVVGASPAATAAWLGPPDAGERHPGACAYLEGVVHQHGALAPCATPVTVFERAWVVATLTRAGIAVAPAPHLIRTLTADLSPAGITAGPGLPPDADTTAVTLYALTRLGVHVDRECLWRYETPDGFCTWPGEDGYSVTTNAHVLDVIGQHLATRPDAQPRYRAAARRLVDALQQRQQPDGSWLDRWHASPYYATMSCALALAEVTGPPVAVTSLTRAADWVVSSQRADGSWGRWEGTVEETAYAVQVLAAVGRGRPGAEEAIERGDAYLAANSAAQDVGPALWHDKDLYRPTMIVRAALLAARHLASGSDSARFQPDLSLTG
ncbi:prenyltransferase/squalene oxidase repeat-containing protein [Micromonospora thermarum]|uniref:Prenyltransferase n=1 Tax=Micromonospora thermarum TaxID=2720024 RepID=A0ABX0Z8W8_9ACTN|nr:prenyltransferase/squalene oxidase repeat-containing protein [Micromonospora thermarum]NJP32468.1 prenyltransferase [Micromonospora thermarum]